MDLFCGALIYILPKEPTPELRSLAESASSYQEEEITAPMDMLFSFVKGNVTYKLNHKDLVVAPECIMCCRLKGLALLWRVSR